MSGDHPPIRIDAARDRVLARAVKALSRFPTDQPWVLVGGIAVFIRLGSITRPTADADTVARSQAELIDRLVAEEITTVVAGGELRIPIGAGDVEIDVMDLADDPLPRDDERCAFALARRHALRTAGWSGSSCPTAEQPWSTPPSPSPRRAPSWPSRPYR